MSHFYRLTSPIIIMIVAYIYVSIIAIILKYNGYYKDNDFFSWGPPVVFFGHIIKDVWMFNLLLCLVFFHQIINNCVNSIVYPWIINNIQDPKNKKMEYSDIVCVIIVNFFDLYSQLDVVFIVMGIMSQVSFVCVIIISNIITSTYINYKYLKAKKEDEMYLLQE